MIKTLFRIRFFQFFRLMSGVGTYRLIFMLLILGVVSYIVFNILKQDSVTTLALVLLGIVILTTHATRKDKHFLKLLAKNVYYIYFFEYLFLVFPFMVIWVINYNWIGVGGLLLFCLIIPLIYFNLGMKNSFSFLLILIDPFSPNLNFKLNISLPFIPVNAFEWISGIRRSIVGMAPIYLLILAFSF